MDAMAPGPGEMLMAHEAAKKVNQVENPMPEVYRRNKKSTCNVFGAAGALGSQT
jgi:hypothetical protein